MLKINNFLQKITLGIAATREDLLEIRKSLENRSHTRQNISRIDDSTYDIAFLQKNHHLKLRIEINILAGSPTKLLVTIPVHQYIASELRKLQKIFHDTFGEKISTAFINSSKLQNKQTEFSIRTRKPIYTVLRLAKGNLYTNRHNSFKKTANGKYIESIEIKRCPVQDNTYLEDWKLKIDIYKNTHDGAAVNSISKDIFYSKIDLFFINHRINKKFYADVSYIYNNGLKINEEVELKKYDLLLEKSIKINLNVSIPESWKAFVKSISHRQDHLIYVHNTIATN